MHNVWKECHSELSEQLAANIAGIYTMLIDKYPDIYQTDLTYWFACTKAKEKTNKIDIENSS